MQGMQAREMPEASALWTGSALSEAIEWRAAPREAAVVQPASLALMWPNPSRGGSWTSRGRQSSGSGTVSSSSIPAFLSTTTRRQSGEGTTPGETLWRYSLSLEHAFSWFYKKKLCSTVRLWVESERCKFVSACLLLFSMFCQSLYLVSYFVLSSEPAWCHQAKGRTMQYPTTTWRV